MNSFRQNKVVFLFLGFLLCAPFALRAGPILNSPETWSSPPSLAGWTNAAPTGTELATLSVPGGGYLQITFGSQGVPAPELDTIYVNTANYTGNYQITQLALRFSFYAASTLPDSALLYMHSAVSTTIWNYAFTSMITGTGVWTQVSVPFDYSAGGWSGWSTDPNDFLADLLSIDRIGISLARDFPNTSQQVYGLDNWEYYAIPEPGVVGMLSSVLLALGLTLRKRAAGGRIG